MSLDKRGISRKNIQNLPINGRARDCHSRRKIINLKYKMPQTCIAIIFLVIIGVNFLTASPAELNHHRQRHHGKNHHKKSHDNEESPTDIHKRTLPPNIWALLATNKKANDDESGPKYNDDIESSHDMNEIADESTDFDTPDDESIKKVAANCPKCKQNSVKMSENELANLRIEYVKNQILHKLRMTERPAPISKDELPEPIQEGYAIQGGDDDTDYLNRHLDDYYAKTTQKIIFLTRGELNFISMNCNKLCHARL